MLVDEIMNFLFNSKKNQDSKGRLPRMKTVATLLSSKISSIWHRSLASPHTVADCCLTIHLFLWAILAT